VGRTIEISVVEHPGSPTFGFVIGYSETDKQIYLYVSFGFMTQQLRINIG
jgi:hypothetical protein